MVIAVLLALGAFASAPLPLLTLNPAATGGPEGVRLTDIADLSALPHPLARRAADLVIWRPTDGRASLDTTSTAVAARARALLPALTPYLPATGPSHRIVLTMSPEAPAVAEAPSRAPAAQCLTLLRDVAPGETPTADDVEPVACGDEKPRVWNLSASGLTAVRGLKSGEIIASPWPTALPVVTRNATLLVGVTVGPVSLQREMVALQDGQAGKPFFVRTPEGEILQAVLPKVAP